MTVETEIMADHQSHHGYQHRFGEAPLSPAFAHDNPHWVPAIPKYNHDFEMTRHPLSPISPTKDNLKDLKVGFRSFFGRSSKPPKVSKDELHPQDGSLSSPTPAPSVRSATSATPSQREFMHQLTPVSSRQSDAKSDARSDAKSNSKSSRSSMKPPKSTKPGAQKAIAPWDPPPLFQAYPQAIKHASLESSVLPADTILRIHNHKRDVAARQDMMNGVADGNESSAISTEKTKSKHKRKYSGSISKSEWVSKIFMLVTSGYILQYPGDGPFDRLPEKILQLGKDSVAIASDAIPGKHWVLQISHMIEGEDKVVAPTSNNLFAKLSLRSNSARRATGNLLLVLNSAEEMNSWMLAVRTEIELLGGRKHEAEHQERRETGSARHVLRKVASERFHTIKEPMDVPDLPIQGRRSLDKPPTAAFLDSLPPDFPSEMSPSFSCRFSYIRPSMDTPSTATTAVSDDQILLDRLRDGSRASYVSSGSWTLQTSPGTSPACSPVKESFGEQARLPAKPAARMLGHDATPLRPRGLSQDSDSHGFTLDVQGTPKALRPQSNYGPTSLRSQSPSSRQPNAGHFGKRYSTMTAPPIPRLPGTTPWPNQSSSVHHKPTGFRQPYQTSARESFHGAAAPPLTRPRSSSRGKISYEQSIVSRTDSAASSHRPSTSHDDSSNASFSTAILDLSNDQPTSQSQQRHESRLAALPPLQTQPATSDGPSSSRPSSSLAAAQAIPPCPSLPPPPPPPNVPLPPIPVFAAGGAGSRTVTTTLELPMGLEPPIPHKSPRRPSSVQVNFGNHPPRSSSFNPIARPALSSTMVNPISMSQGSSLLKAPHLVNHRKSMPAMPAIGVASSGPSSWKGSFVASHEPMPSTLGVAMAQTPLSPVMPSPLEVPGANGTGVESFPGLEPPRPPPTSSLPPLPLDQQHRPSSSSSAQSTSSRPHLLIPAQGRPTSSSSTHSKTLSAPRHHRARSSTSSSHSHSTQWSSTPKKGKKKERVESFQLPMQQLPPLESVANLPQMMPPPSGPLPALPPGAVAPAVAATHAPSQA